MEIRHNYDAVNAAITQQQQNAYEELQRRKATRWSLYGSSAIKFGIASAILILALSFAWWLFGDAGYSSVSESDGKQRLVEIIRNVPSETATGAKINSEFVIFHTVENTDGSETVTGWRYKPEDIETPYHKYCYWSQRSDSDPNKHERVDLGYTNENGKPEWSDVEFKYKKYFGDCEFGLSEISSTTESNNPGARVFEKTWQSIVYIESGDGQGSGVIVGASRVVTNCHVVESGNVHVVYPPHSRQATAKNGIRATVERRDIKRDFCLLRVPNIRGQLASIRKFNTLQVGEAVYALGAPQGLELTLTSGLISQLRHDEGVRVIQTNAAISPGSSGGGLFDSEGNLVGITTSVFAEDDAQGLNFAIPADLVLRK